MRLKDYIAKKEMGTLKMDKFQKRMNTALQKVRDFTDTGGGWYAMAHALMGGRKQQASVLAVLNFCSEKKKNPAPLLGGGGNGMGGAESGVSECWARIGK